MKAAAILFVLTVSSARLARAHGSNHDSESLLHTPLWIWGLGLALLACVAAVLYFQAKHGRPGGERFRGFSRNAKLLLNTLGGAIFGSAFILYYVHFARLDVPEATLAPATARSRV